MDGEHDRRAAHHIRLLPHAEEGPLHIVELPPDDLEEDEERAEKEVEHILPEVVEPLHRHALLTVTETAPRVMTLSLSSMTSASGVEIVTLEAPA